MEIQFEATRSFCYKFGRYTVLADVQQMPEVTSGNEFRLTDLAQRVIEKYLGWMQTVLGRNPKGDKHLVGARLSYADLSLFQLVEGLLYAFPMATRLAGRFSGRFRCSEISLPRN